MMLIATTGASIQKSKNRVMAVCEGIENVCVLGDHRFDRLAGSWATALRELRVNVIALDHNELKPSLGPVLRNRFGNRLFRHNYTARRILSKEYNESVVNTVIRSGADALVITNGEYLFPSTLSKIRKSGIPVALFFADNPLPPHYNNRPETLPAGKEVDFYLIWSSQLVRTLETVGITNVRLFHFAWDPNVFPYVDTPERPWPGVVFIGGWDPDRERFLNEIASRFPLKIYGPAYWGTRTAKNSLARKCWQGRALRGTEVAEEIRNSAIALNILRSQHIMEGRPSGMIMRHFEVPGAGGFMLSTRSSDATHVFPEGELGAYFEDLDECCEKIEFFLANPKKRREIANAAHDLVSQHHTYRHRMSELCHMLSEAVAVKQ